MTKDEALKQALEALERSVATCFDQYAHQQVMSQPDHFINQAITAIKEALDECDEDELIIRYHEMTIKRLEKRIEELTAQPEQESVDPEPFGYFQYDIRLDAWVQDHSNSKGAAFYTAPPQPKERNFCSRCGKRTFVSSMD